jgi:hypothetical protein
LLETIQHSTLEFVAKFNRLPNEATTLRGFLVFPYTFNLPRVRPFLSFYLAYKTSGLVHWGRNKTISIVNIKLVRINISLYYRAIFIQESYTRKEKDT